MSEEFCMEDFRSIEATAQGYRVVVKGQQKNLERTNPADSEEIDLLDKIVEKKGQ